MKMYTDLPLVPFWNLLPNYTREEFKGKPHLILEIVKVKSGKGFLCKGENYATFFFKKSVPGCFLDDLFKKYAEQEAFELETLFMIGSGTDVVNLGADESSMAIYEREGSSIAFFKMSTPQPLSPPYSEEDLKVKKNATKRP